MAGIDTPTPGGLAGTPINSNKPAQIQASRRRWIWLVLLGVFGFIAWQFYIRTARGDARDSPAGKLKARSGSVAVPVVVATAHGGDLPVYLNGLGSATPFNTVTVRTRIDGQLTSVVFQEGQFVHQGDLLAEIDPRPYQVQLEQAEGQYARDLAQLNEAKLDSDRNSLLFQQGIIPKQQADAQAAVVNQFDGAIKTDQAQIDNAKLQLTYCQITAPISGQIGLRLVDQGNMVHANDPNGLVVIEQVQPIAVLFSLPQDDLTQVTKALRSGVSLSLEAYDRDNAVKIATGKLLTIDNQIDPSTGTYRLKAVFDNDNKILFPNQFVNVHLLSDTKYGLTIVPAPAIQRGPQGTFVYVVTTDGTVTVRPIKSDLTNGNLVGISDGLQPGESVVIDGQDKLQEGMKVAVQTSEGGHPEEGSME